MTEILQIFSGNPMSTFIGKKIEAATRPELESDDWALNLEICDIINENDDDAKDAVRAIRKRLQQIEQDRNFIITNRTLTVLETCVSNCSRRFHLLVMTKDFIQDLVKLIGPKNNPPIDLQERVLRMIERWADAFKTQPDMSGVVTVYNDLKAKGVTFPPKDPSSNVPIQTPQRSVPAQPGSSPTTNQQYSTTSSTRDQRQRHRQQQQQQQLQSQPTGPIVLEGEGYNKISQDLTIVQSSIEMFNDIVRLIETKNDESDWKLAADLSTTCRQMKDRIVDLIERVANEDLTIEFLRLNDELNSIFDKYDRLVKNRPTKSSISQPTMPDPNSTLLIGSNNETTSTNLPQAAGNRDSSRPENELSLIDFNADDSLGGDKNNSQGKNIPLVQDPFDSSAVIDALSKTFKSSSSQQQRQVEPLVENLNKLSMTSESQTNKPKSTSGLPEEISSVREQDFAEIENWLKNDSGRDLGGDLSSIEPISIPNSEFENFIATRALAGSNAPASSSASTQPKQTSQKPEPSM